MTYTEQLEQESEQTRRRLAYDLEELRARISPGQVVDQVVDYVQDGSGAEFFGNLRRQVVSNPLPVALVGAGLAWLMLSNGTKSDGRATDRFDDTFDDVAESARDAGEAIRGGIRSGASSVSETAAEARRRAGAMADAAASAGSDFVDSAYDSATGAYASMTEGAERTRAAVAEGTERARVAVVEGTERARAAVAGSAKRLGRNADALADFCREQPLVLAAVGVALGAAIGAMLPSTETEDRLIGEASDQAKDAIRATASETLDKAVAVGERALDAASDEASKQGLTTSSDSGDGEPEATHTAEEHGSGAIPPADAVLVTAPPPKTP